MLRVALLSLALGAALGCSKAESKPTDSKPGEPAAAPSKPNADGEKVATSGGAGGAAQAAPTSAEGATAPGGGEAVVTGAGTRPTAPRGASPAKGGGATTTGDGTYTLALEAPAAVAPGGETVARVRVTPGNGYKMNKDFPTKLTLTPVSGVKLAKDTFVLADAESFDEHQLVFAVKATPESAGEFTVAGKLKFAVCTDATCDPKREDIAIKVAAK